tara:strand:- start:573 stop:848 length:276 start_codon:yes stop_codon:yes gene_type:complete
MVKLGEDRELQVLRVRQDQLVLKVPLDPRDRLVLRDHQVILVHKVHKVIRGTLEALGQLVHKVHKVLLELQHHKVLRVHKVHKVMMVMMRV